VVWTVRDVSERAQLEQAKSDFVATASHELRSPLTSIKGFVELLATSPDGMSDRQREFVQIILRSTDRLVELVNDLLDVARIEAGHVEINRRAIDAGQAVREVVELIGPRVEAKQQTLRCHLGPALPLALADPARLRQIVANLLTNAHLYTPEGGRLEVSAEADGPWVKMSITDSGVGIPAEEVERVFDRFYRGSDGRTAPGTGLGLSIVKSLVDLHEGRIEVSSRPGEGTTFTIRIPSATGALGLTPSLEALRGRRILVVDDEPEIAQLIADQLAPFEVECTIAAGGREALEQLQGETFDAVTLDVKMPGMSGLDVLRQIRRDPVNHDLPVVFVSVASDHQDLAREWIVSKPIDADELREVLGAAVASGRSRVLVVGREEVREELAQSLEEFRIEYHWETSGATAARVCSERRFEVALVDVGLRNPQAVLQALNLRGRRLRRAVILFTDGQRPLPEGIHRLGLEVVPIEGAGEALVTALHEEPAAET
jgi:CheY-like chemotaxis protein/two-component sensor histidine kinase